MLRNYYMFPWNQGKRTYDGFLSKLLIKKKKKGKKRIWGYEVRLTFLWLLRQQKE